MIRRTIILIICAVAGLLAWKFLPNTLLDRALFSATVRTFVDRPFFTTGKGSHYSPYKLRMLKDFSGKTPEILPTVVSLGDDPDGIFQSSPPGPIDYAIILKNLNRLGMEIPTIATPLAWGETDTFSLIALDQQLNANKGVITCAPLSRNPVPSPLPPAFRRASIPISEIDGDVRKLPIVNRIPIPDIILGNDRSLAGFSILESESATDSPHLLARWDGEDRVVLALPLLTALSINRILPSALKIRLGEYISLGKEGPFIPIDDYGRLSFKPPLVTAEKVTPAPSLIDAPDDLFSQIAPNSIILRDDFSASSQTNSDFSKSLVGLIGAMADPNFSSLSRSFPRLSDHIELLFLGSLFFLILSIGRHRFLKGRLPAIAIAVVVLGIHLVIVPLTLTWPPTLPALIMTTIAAFIPVATKIRKIDRVNEDEAAKLNLPAFKEESEPQTAKKAPVKKTAKKAKKKAAPKKSSRKGSSKKAARRSKKP